MRWRSGVLVAVVCIAVLMLTFGIPTAAARGTSGVATAGAMNHTIVVLPNGHDDTADIQAAFNACVSYGPGCTVELTQGTYYTAQIAVYGFHGSFVGAGQGRTVIQALPNLPDPNPTYNSPTVPFWAGNPTGAAGSNPWPDLFTFMGGTFSINGMTLTEPYENPIACPSTTSCGWYGLPGFYYPVELTALYAVIMVTGEQANAAITQVTVNGAAGPDFTVPFGTPSTFNVGGGIVYEGMLCQSALGPNACFAEANQMPVSGTVSLTDSTIYWIYCAFDFQNLLDAKVVVNSNLIKSSVGPEFIDVSNSLLYFVGNTFTNIMYGDAIFGGQAAYRTGLLPSTVYAEDNYMGVNWYGSGLSFWDWGPSVWGTDSTLNAVESGNTIVTDNSCECYTAAVVEVNYDYELESAVVSGNTIIGGGGGVWVESGPETGPVSISGNTILGADYGVWLQDANYTHVVGNVIKDSVQYGIALTNESSYNVIAWNFVQNSGVDDLYWDGTGTDNTWVHNICQTSSPAGLC